MSRYIDADKLWKEIESVEYYGRDTEVSRICGLIQNAPTVEIKPIIYYAGEFNFCPYCGADMKRSD